jgi:hypothetical protein
MEETPAAGDAPEFFSFDTPEDGRRQCRVERLPLPDGRRTAFVIEDVSPGPGRSVVSVVEAVATDLCRRHGVAPADAVWVRQYRAMHGRPPYWERVTFRLAPNGHLYDPQWQLMRPRDWQDLGLPPRGDAGDGG